MAVSPISLPNHSSAPLRLGVLTSGGDAQGMNAAVRAVVRAAVGMGAEPYAIREGYRGAVEGGAGISPLGWDDVGSIQHRGGTIIGTARCAEFRERDGMRRAAANLVTRDIDRLVVIGGDGTLGGTAEFQALWPELLAELVEAGEITSAAAAAHPALIVCGLVGSIDNDFVGTETTIGADSALHRIVEAIDAIASTAASHQRSFVVEVMGRHCGYLPLAAAIAGGTDYVFVPENPPAETWKEELCDALRRGREAGRRDSIVVVAEGAADRNGNPIKADQIRGVLAETLGEDTRVTILGHVQRGGTPSAYDRWMSTVLGHTAARTALESGPGTGPVLLGVKRNRVAQIPLTEGLEETRSVAGLIERGEYEQAISTRGATFGELLSIFDDMSNPPRSPLPDSARRIGVIHGAGLAPGMNTAVRAAVRLGIARGHRMIGIRGSFRGLIDGRAEELEWGAVDELVGEGGAELGTSRWVPLPRDLYAVARAIEETRLDALLIIGGYNAYVSASVLDAERERYPAFAIPTVCVPVSIDNNLPGSELAVGADTALNVAVTSLDRIKQSASASRRCFVAETMGRRCGYLAMMAGIAAGAERVYLNEDGIELRALLADVSRMRALFRGGRQLYLAIRNEAADEKYTTDFLARVFDRESEGLYDVRTAVIGHTQQGGNPTPFDRLLATRLVHHAIDDIGEQFAQDGTDARYVGLDEGVLRLAPMSEMAKVIDPLVRRPRRQWWQALRPTLDAMAEAPHG